MPDQSELDNIMRNNPQNTKPPQTTDEFYAESFADVLVKSLGYYAVCEFLIGTNNIIVKEGILYAAGLNFVTLQDPETERYTICDMYALKFVTIYPAQSKPSVSTPPYVQQQAPYQQGMRMTQQQRPYSYG